MGVKVIKNFFSTKEEVMQDLIKTGFWPTTYVSDPSDELPLHWHDGETHGYVMEGSTYVVDGETGEKLTIEKGDKLELPARVVHAEGEVNERVVYIVALPGAYNFFDFFEMKDPALLEQKA